MKEQCGEEVSGSVDRNRQLRRSQSPETRLIAGEHIESVGRRVVELERFHDDDRWPAGAERSDRLPCPSQILNSLAGQPFELEGVRRCDGRQGHGAIAEEL